MKENAVYQVKAEFAVPQNRNVLKDQLIWFPSQVKAAKSRACSGGWRSGTKTSRNPIAFLTSLLQLGATTIAAIYKDRWQVELFFKALKQNLKIKTFVGTSANAVKTQVWTALIALLMLKYLQLKSRFGWSLSNLIALLRQQLSCIRISTSGWTIRFQAPPALAGVHDAQLDLALEW